MLRTIEAAEVAKSEVKTLPIVLVTAAEAAELSPVKDLALALTTVAESPAECDVKTLLLTVTLAAVNAASTAAKVRVAIRTAIAVLGRATALQVLLPVLDAEASIAETAVISFESDRVNAAVLAADVPSFVGAAVFGSKALNAAIEAVSGLLVFVPRVLTPVVLLPTKNNQRWGAGPVGTAGVRCIWDRTLPEGSEK